MCSHNIKSIKAEISSNLTSLLMVKLNLISHDVFKLNPLDNKNFDANANNLIINVFLDILRLIIEARLEDDKRVAYSSAKTYFIELANIVVFFNQYGYKKLLKTELIKKRESEAVKIIEYTNGDLLNYLIICSSNIFKN